MIAHVNPVLLDKLMETITNKKISKWYKGGYKLVSILDTDGFVLYMSENCKTIMTVDSDDIVGMYAFDFVHKDELDKVINEFSKVLVTKKPTEMDVTLNTSDGWSVVKIKAIPIVRLNKTVAIITLGRKKLDFLDQIEYFPKTVKIDRYH